MNKEYKRYLMSQLKQQERIVSQLVGIVAKTNTKVKTLQLKVEQLEKRQTIKKSKPSI